MDMALVAVVVTEVWATEVAGVVKTMDGVKAVWVMDSVTTVANKATLAGQSAPHPPVVDIHGALLMEVREILCFS